MDQFVGQIVAVESSFVPKGWVACNGQMLSITEYNALFSLIGATFGGDGQSKFAVPDLRVRSSLIQKSGIELSANVTGEVGVSEDVPLNDAHTHGLVTSIATERVSMLSADVMLANQPNAAFDVYALSPVDTDFSCVASNLADGNNQCYETHQPTDGVKYIMSIVGVYPSRN